MSMAQIGPLTDVHFSLKLYVMLLSCWVTAGYVHGLTPDGASLLEVKNSLIDHDGILSSWVASDESPCHWYGVACLEDGLSVRYLNLSAHYSNLRGTLSPSLGKLARLEELDLAYNNFSGSLPKELGNCSELRYIDIGFNPLISGTLPAEFGKLSNLQYLSLGGLQLGGNIPDELGSLTSLRDLYLHKNNLTGPIPSSFGALHEVSIMWLWSNSLQGPLPASMGSCRNLSFLDLKNNQLTGSIPSTFGQLQNLEYLDFTNNALTGAIPPELGNCTSLTSAFFGLNELSGRIPEEMVRLPNLTTLFMNGNMLTGPIPTELGRHSNLQAFDVHSNQLSGRIPAGLCQFRRLSVLILFDNLLDGELPVELLQCPTLQRLRIHRNRLTGTIPPEIGQNTAIYHFEADFNTLTGRIPVELGSCINLTAILLSHNRLSGTIPSSLGHLPRLASLNLSSNQLNSSLPSELGDLRDLFKLDVSENHLSGDVPAALSSISSLRVLNLNDNELTGLPDLWSSLDKLEELQLAGNMFQGSISSGIGKLRSLQTVLNLSRNHFTGPVPPELGGLELLEKLDLSQNNLSGEIPSSLDDMQSLLFVDVSYNSLIGPLPSSWLKIVTADSFLGNPGLCPSSENCTSASSSPSAENDKDRGLSIPATVGVAVGAACAIAAALIVVGIVVHRRQRRMHVLTEKSEGKLQIWSRDPKYKSLTFPEIHDATIGSDSADIVSRTTSSTVYRAQLRSGPVLAIKVLNEELDDTAERLYRMETQIIGKVRHRNLVELIGLCEWKKLKFLVLNFFNNGSLSQVLHNQQSKGLRDWDSRYKVAVGTAQGLEYLHHDCKPPILHRDVKPSNILLDDDFEPHVADFGCAKVRDFSKSNPSTSAVVGTYGYIAPEYGFNVQVTEKVDVYAFEVVLLELLTGKRPLDPAFEEGATIVTWVEANSSETKLLNEVLDRRLVVSDESHVVEEMLLVLKVAVFCTNKVPGERPTMREVVAMLKQARDPRKNQKGSKGGAVFTEK